MRFRALLLLMIVAVLGASQARATWQIPDILIYEGKEYPIVFSTMMSDYFVKYPDREPKDDRDQCSAASLGYQAVFEVSENVIYLKDIFSDPCRARRSVMEKVTPNRKRLAIDWYTGFLISVDGNNRALSPYSAEFLDGFEKYAFFQVDGGRISKVRQFDNKGYREFKKRQFEAYKKTPAYQEEVKRFGDPPRRNDSEAGIYSYFLLYMDRFYTE
jgi:hypothetical protein